MDNLITDPILRQQIEDFLVYETSLLDAGRLESWLNVVTEDFTYRVPITSTSSELGAKSWSEDYLVVDETKDSIAKLWLVRQTPAGWRSAWGENPAQRTRRFVTNTRITQSEESNACVAQSNVLLTFVRESEDVVLVPAQRVDIVRIVDEKALLAKRLVLIDTTIVKTGHLRLIF